MKSGLGKLSLKFLHALTMFFLLLNLYFCSKFKFTYGDSKVFTYVTKNRANLT